VRSAVSARHLQSYLGGVRGPQPERAQLCDRCRSPRELSATRGGANLLKHAFRDVTADEPFESRCSRVFGLRHVPAPSCLGVALWVRWRKRRRATQLLSNPSHSVFMTTSRRAAGPGFGPCTYRQASRAGTSTRNDRMARSRQASASPLTPSDQSVGSHCLAPRGIAAARRCCQVGLADCHILAF
jgi:hypothetical protein